MADQVITIIFLVFYGIVFVTNLVGNSLVCAVVARSKCLQNFASFLLVNLAIGDLLLGVSSSVHLILSVVSSQERYTFCALMSTLVYLSGTVSLYTITALAFDRYIAITKPLYHRTKVNTRKLKAIIPIIWTTSILLALPSLVFLTSKQYSNVNEKENTVACWDVLPMEDFPKGYKIILFILMYVLPMTTTGVSYGLTFRYLWGGKNKSAKSTNRVMLASRRKLTKVLGVVIIAFNICWLPWFVVDLLSSLNSIPKYDYLRSEITTIFAVAHSSLNPIVYSLRSKNFRNHISKLVKRK